MCSLRYWAASMGRPESTHPVAPSRSAFVATPCFRREPDTSPVRPHDGLNLSHHCNGLTCPYLPNGFQLELSRVLRTHLLFTHLSTPCRYFQQGLRTPLFRGNLTATPRFFWLMWSLRMGTRVCTLVSKLCLHMACSFFSAFSFR